MDLSNPIQFDSIAAVGNLFAYSMVGGGGIYVWRSSQQRRRQAHSWDVVADKLGLVLRQIDKEPMPRLSGIYRGRAVEAGFSGGQLHCTSLALNPAHIFDVFHSDEALPDAPWLTPASRETLCALRDMGRRWSVRIQGRSLRLSCVMAGDTPDQLRFLLDLSCDLAEGVDNPYPNNSFAVVSIR